MKKILQDDVSYKTFQDILTGYRLSNTMTVAFESGVLELLSSQALSADEICIKTGWDKEMGGRFLSALCGLGFLEKKDGRVLLSSFSRKFLLKTSEQYQGSSIEFEDRLIDSWRLLAPALEKGERVYSTENKTKDEYRKALKLYIRAMDDAAVIRAGEVWDIIKPHGTGTILDAGAGSGAFLFEFLTRHDGWHGVFCDLADVILIAKEKKEAKTLSGRLTWVESNLLEESLFEKNEGVSIALMSNLIHCQGKDETSVILSNVTKQVADDGVILIHDFFTDCGWRGALYDIHMMLNTYNGRTYSVEETVRMLFDYDFTYTETIQLQSGSTLLTASRKPFPLELLC